MTMQCPEGPRTFSKATTSASIVHDRKGEIWYHSGEVDRIFLPIYSRTQQVGDSLQKSGNLGQIWVDAEEIWGAAARWPHLDLVIPQTPIGCSFAPRVPIGLCLIPPTLCQLREVQQTLNTSATL